MILLRTLGQIDVEDSAGRDVRTVLAQSKRLALLIYLALAKPAGYRRRDTVVGLFWPELDEEHARGSLRQALSFLRRALGEDIVLTRGEEEVAANPAALWCDATAFDEAAGARRDADALALYRGEFLEGLFVSDAAPELEQWVDGERSSYRRRAAACAWALAEQRRAAGDFASAGPLARRAAALAGEDERAAARLITFLDALGDRSGALEAYDALGRRLKDEYDAEPSPETQAAVQRVRGRSAAGTAEEIPTPPESSAAPGRGSGARRERTLLYLGLAGVVGLIGYIAAFAIRRVPFDPVRATVAVLPLVDLSGDSAQFYLAYGVTDQLITDLAQGGALRVINPRTMMVYRDSALTARDIAQRLHADAVVSGTLQRLGDTIYMTAQLVLAKDDRTLWAQGFEGSRGDLLRMQREVARAVTRRLRGALTPAQEAGLASVGSSDPEALDFYIQGRYWWNKRGPGLLKSIALFTQALDADPTFSLAYSGVADAYVQLGYASLLAPGDAFPKAEAAALHALQLDSTLAEPHAALGFVRMYYTWDWAGADREFHHALALNPSYATGHEWYGLFLTAMGRKQEALNHERRAQELDPLSPSIASTTGWVLHYSGRQDDAERELLVALRMDSTFALAHFYLGRVYQAKDRLDSALSQYAATGALRSWVPTVAGQGYVLGVLGRQGEARATLARMDSLSRRQYVTAYAMALVHAALGQRDSAFAWLERGVRERTHWMVWLNRDLRWAPLRADPRFQALVHEVGLPP
jgi:DNA-binding SARP family transcriptional activator/TolB-like protein/Tfp pilus assembly protein PilF